MNRTLAIIIAVLVLASAGWWGWTRPDLLPGVQADREPRDSVTAPTQTTAPPSDAPSPSPDAEAEPAQEPPAPEPQTPAQTPAPRDAALPPESGSALARETEAVAEAAIAAADARARAEAQARAERLALEAAQDQLKAALSPMLTPAGFSTDALRGAITALPAPDTDLAGQARNRLLAEIDAILTEAETAERDAAARPPTLTPTLPEGLPAIAVSGASTLSAGPAPVFRPDPFISRIEQLF